MAGGDEELVHGGLGDWGDAAAVDGGTCAEATARQQVGFSANSIELQWQGNAAIARATALLEQAMTNEGHSSSAASLLEQLQVITMPVTAGALCPVLMRIASSWRHGVWSQANDAGVTGQLSEAERLAVVRLATRMGPVSWGGRFAKQAACPRSEAGCERHWLTDGPTMQAAGASVPAVPADAQVSAMPQRCPRDGRRGLAAACAAARG